MLKKRNPSKTGVSYEILYHIFRKKKVECYLHTFFSELNAQFAKSIDSRYPNSKFHKYVEILKIPQFVL